MPPGPFCTVGMLGMARSASVGDARTSRRHGPRRPKGGRARRPRERGWTVTANYTFSTVKIVAHAARGESVNIGVLLYDPAKRLLYRKITDNWAEVRRRTGVESLPDLGAVSGPGPVDADDGYLDALSDSSPPSGIVVTKPRSLMPFDGRLEALEWAYRSQVGVPDGEPGQRAGRAD